ncbi:MAG: glycosyltransferase [Acidobacteria bacterium]|nr:MAG: glycosyltransferase [Acidobacteriota bacterium]
MAGDSPQPAISVVVPTRGRPAMLRRCLAALARQDAGGMPFEVMVVDDGPDDATREVVTQQINNSTNQQMTICYIPAGPGRGPAAARNVGWRAARAEFVAFTDDDCVPLRTWLAAGLEALRQGAAGACGQVTVPVPERPTDYERDVAGLQRSLFVTANCFYRRHALEAIGGFDTRFAIAWREDSDLFFGMLERGVPLVFLPAAVVVHPVRPAPWGISVRQQRRNLFNALLYKKHPGLYRQRVQPRPPLAYYGVVALLAVALVAVVAGFPVAAIAAGAGWLAWTLRFSLRRLRGTSPAGRHVAEMIVTSALIPPLAVFWRLAGAARFKVFFF